MFIRNPLAKNHAATAENHKKKQQLIRQAAKATKTNNEPLFQGQSISEHLVNRNTQKKCAKTKFQVFN